MIMNDVRLSWKVITNKQFLKFVFKGTLTRDLAVQAIKDWSGKLSGVSPDNNVSLIWNCVEMTKYEIDAFKLWHEALLESKSHIEEIWIVTDNSFYKLAARTMSMVSSLKLKCVTTEEEISV